MFLFLYLNDYFRGQLTLFPTVILFKIDFFSSSLEIMFFSFRLNTTTVDGMNFLEITFFKGIYVFSKLFALENNRFSCSGNYVILVLFSN